MSAIKYPNGIKPAFATQSSETHSGRGMRLESDLNESNKYYRANDIALIYKKPTPIQVVRVDYEAYYRTPSTTDYNGVYRGRYIDFEAKETKNKARFPLFMIHPHQVEHLKKVHLHGGIGFFIIRFTLYNATYLVDSEELINEMYATNQQSIPCAWFKEHGHLIPEGFNPRLAYLKVVDSIYFKEERHNGK